MAEIADKNEALRLLHRVGVALSAERNRERLVEMILLEAKQLCNADGGTLYLRTEDERLQFEIVRTDSLGVALGGTTGEPISFEPIPLYHPDGSPNRGNVVTCAVHNHESFNIPDAYDAAGFDFSGTKRFDERSGYRSKSFLTVPLENRDGHVIGVLQLINARDENGDVVSFPHDKLQIVEALAGQAAVALDNQMLFEAQRTLLESFIQLIAAAIDAKSPYTGGHCERVPVLTEMITRAACEAKEGPLADFDLTDEEWYELKIAAWLHDCGKVTTPVHVMDKATKLETIYDRIDTIKARYEVLLRDAEIAKLKALLAGTEESAAEAIYRQTVERLRSELVFLENANIGGEFLSSEKQDEIRRIGAQPITINDEERPLLDEDELENLCISRGTLTESERLEINAHMVQTIRMLEALPWPRNLRRVPEYAGGHHERMDGNGYPKGIYAGDMSIPARIMAVADVFEALTASDRPYKKAKTLSETMSIMSKMKEFNHLDPELFDFFARSPVWRDYAERYLAPYQIDDVDIDALVAVEPKSFELPEPEVRQERWEDFLPEYREK